MKGKATAREERGRGEREDSRDDKGDNKKDRVNETDDGRNNSKDDRLKGEMKDNKKTVKSKLARYSCYEWKFIIWMVSKEMVVQYLNGQRNGSTVSRWSKRMVVSYFKAQYQWKYRISMVQMNGSVVS